MNKKALALQTLVGIAIFTVAGILLIYSFFFPGQLFSRSTSLTPETNLSLILHPELKDLTISKEAAQVYDELVSLFKKAATSKDSRCFIHQKDFPDFKGANIAMVASGSDTIIQAIDNKGRLVKETTITGILPCITAGTSEIVDNFRNNNLVVGDTYRPSTYTRPGASFTWTYDTNKKNYYATVPTERISSKTSPPAKDEVATYGGIDSWKYSPNLGWIAEISVEQFLETVFVKPLPESYNPSSIVTNEKDVIYIYGKKYTLEDNDCCDSAPKINVLYKPNANHLCFIPTNWVRNDAEGINNDDIELLAAKKECS